MGTICLNFAEVKGHSTVTDLAKFRGQSTLQPLKTRCTYFTRFTLHMHMMRMKKKINTTRMVMIGTSRPQGGMRDENKNIARIANAVQVTI